MSKLWYWKACFDYIETGPKVYIPRNYISKFLIKGRYNYLVLNQKGFEVIFGHSEAKKLSIHSATISIVIR